MKVESLMHTLIVTLETIKASQFELDGGGIIRKII